MPGLCEITLAAWIANTAVVEIAESVGANLGADAVAQGGGAVFAQIQRRLDRARAAGRLPANHHLERATARAGVLASRHCLQRMIDDGQAGALDDIVLPAGHHLPDGKRNTTARNAVQAALTGFAEGLEPAAGRRGEAAERRTLKLLADASLPLASAGLDAIGLKGLARINVADTAPLAPAPAPPPAPRPGFWAGIADRLRPGPRPSAAAAAPPRADVAAARLAELTRLREDEAPDLAQMVVTQAIRLGRWHPDRHAAVGAALMQSLFGPEESWLTAFALFYAEEQRADERLHKLSVLLRLERQDDASAIVLLGQEEARAAAERFHADLQASLGGLASAIEQTARHSEEAAAAARQVLKELRAHFSSRNDYIFQATGTEGAGGAPGEYRPFHFASEQDAFVGREEVLAAIGDRLLAADDDAPFRWAAICGNAGSGKSRLALQILAEAGDRWPFSGFVRPAFIGHAELKLDLATITGPALFVIDYAGSQAEQCCRFIELCARQADSAPFPVRAILLLRRTNDRFFQIIKGRDGGAAQHTQVRFGSDGEDGEGALVIESLAPADTATLMRGRMGRRGAAFDDEGLRAVLRRYDESERPLFALIVADSLARDGLPGVAETDTPEQTRLRLLRAYLKHQFTHHWSESGHGSADHHDAVVDRHLSLLLFSTMCRGSADRDWLSLLDGPAAERNRVAADQLFPVHPDRDQSHPYRLNEGGVLIQMAGSARATPDDLLPVLEPDLLGEALVLLMLDKEGDGIALTDWTALRRRKNLRDLAWCADPAGAAYFALLVAQDFPAEAERWGWLLPDEHTGASAADRARLFHSLALSLVSPLQRRAARLTDIRQMRALIDGFSDLPEDDEAVAFEYATGLTWITEQLAFVINKGRPPKAAPITPPLQDKQARTADHGADQSSTAFNRASDSQDGRLEQAEIAYLESDAETVAAAIVLLIDLAPAALDRLARAPSFRVGRAFAALIAAVLCSALWVYRADRERLGRAETPPGEEEIALREAIAARCAGRLRSADLTGDDVGLFAPVISATIYADHGADATRAELAFHAVRQVARQDGFKNPEAVAAAIGVLGNCTYSYVATVLAAPEGGGDPAGTGATIDEILQLANRLFDGAVASGPVEERVRSGLVANWASVVGRVLQYRAMRQSGDPVEMTAFFTRFDAFVERHGVTPLDDDHLDVVNAMFDAAPDERGPVLATHLAHLEVHGLDPAQLERRDWDNLSRYLYRLALCPASMRNRVAALVEREADAVGGRFARDLAQAICWLKTGAANSAEWLAQLAAIARPRLVKAKDWHWREAISLVLAAQHLFEADDGAVFALAEDHWAADPGTPELALAERVTALGLVHLLLSWCPITDPRLQPWRARLIALLATGPDEVNAAAALVARFAEAEIAAGLPAEDWIVQERPA